MFPQLSIAAAATQVLWVEQARGRPALRPAAQALRDSVSSAVGRLLGQLYDRNCRREFAPAEAFYAATLSADLFNAEVQQSLARGAFLEAKNTRVWQVLRSAPLLPDELPALPPTTPVPPLRD